MRMYYDSRWVDKAEQIEVRNPFDSTLIDTVPKADTADIDRALAALVHGAEVMRRTTAYDRSKILHRAAELLASRADAFGRTISSEEGKTLAEGRFEVSRAAETLQLSAEEAKRLGGEVLPLDGAPGGAGKLGFTLRVPCGVVAAITPFNFPLNLVCHKVGPALAAGNAVMLKPASDTPLTALKLVELLLEAGLPAEGIACLAGSGKTVGDAIARDPRVRKISFTGSRDVGEHLCQVAGLKRITMELGSNSPLVILPDADMKRVADAVIATGYGNAGQVCISAQRVIGVGNAYDALVETLPSRVNSLVFGNQLDEKTQMGPMIREGDAVRVEQWIGDAVRGGAKVLAGGTRRESLVAPTLVADVAPEMRISCDELFGPAVGLTRAADVESAIRLANDSRYGLSAGVFTQSLDAALRFAREVESGNIHINWGPAWRADLMPYGGLKESGFGKEGPKYAIHEMTELKTVVIHGV
ncbi:MAG: aldehyde dehydrogenase family protein [Planctomycetes bacterium]|nr:aldehyde dehydrogenase family protein [Planctomycetota bacterium]